MNNSKNNERIRFESFQVDGSDEEDEDEDHGNNEDDKDGDNNESLENVVDNDEGEEMHLRKIAEQNRDASADGDEEETAATGQETGSSSASRELVDVDWR